MTDDLLIDRIDHLVVRVAAPCYGELHQRLTTRLGLPAAWPPSRMPGFVSSGVFAGNVHLELLQLGPTRPADGREAEPYGIALRPTRPLVALRRDLARRGLRTSAAIRYSGPDEAGEQQHLWTNLFIAGLVGDNPWLRLFCWMTALRGEEAPGAQPSGRLMWAFTERVLANGMHFAVTYQPDFPAPLERMSHDREVLAARDGGPLGVRGVRTVEVRATDPARTTANWQALLAPQRPADGRFTLGDGPAVEVVPGADDRVGALVLEVASLEKAAAFLEREGMLEQRTDGAITLDADALLGLEVRLVETDAD